jgi:hypothetical protein
VSVFSNDHYPFYEFLFIEDGNSYKLIKYQKIYTDFAGIEGVEYGHLAPFISLSLTLLGIVVSIIIIVMKIMYSNFQTARLKKIRIFAKSNQ